jgi:phosphate-selective porin OprO and OprP
MRSQGLGRLRIGNFFVPFSLEQVTNDTNNIFMERSIPTQGVFAADREVGIALYNCTEDQRITWATGAFFDSISEGLKERIDDNQG